MRYRRLGKTGLMVSEVGFGAWGIGGSFWKGSDDTESRAALHAAIDAGVNFIDTALVYGDGHSERLVGEVVRSRSERIFVATKVPPRNEHWPALPEDRVADAFPPGHIIAATEESLRHLKMECLDLQQLHVWRDEWLEDDAWPEVIGRLKQEGKIRAFGLSLNDHDPGSGLRAVNTGIVDTIQVIYNIFDQSPAERLLPACARHDVGVLARCPFDEGGLTGAITPETTFPPGDWRNEYFRGDRKAEVAARVRALCGYLGPEVRTLPELALRFCLSHPAVSTVIPGMRTAQHARANAQAAERGGLGDALRSALAAHAWQRNFYD